MLTSIRKWNCIIAYSSPLNIPIIYANTVISITCKTIFLPVKYNSVNTIDFEVYFASKIVSNFIVLSIVRAQLIQPIRAQLN